MGLGRCEKLDSPTTFLLSGRACASLRAPGSCHAWVYLLLRHGPLPLECDDLLHAPLFDKPLLATRRMPDVLVLLLSLLRRSWPLQDVVRLGSQQFLSGLFGLLWPTHPSHRLYGSRNFGQILRRLPRLAPFEGLKDLKGIMCSCGAL